MYSTYILESKTSGRLYIGQTQDLEKRLIRHNSGLNLSTKIRGPWDLLFFKEFLTRAEAVQLEIKLKRFKNPAKVKDWISKPDIF